MQNPEQDRFSVLSQYEKRIEARLRKRGIPREEVADYRQETFRRVIVYLKTREITESLPGLLATIADYVVVDYFEMKRIEAEGSSQLLDDEEEATSDPEGELNEAEVKKHLAEVLANCDERARALLVARFYEEKTLQQIAQEMGIPLSTAHHLIGEGIKQVAFELREKRKVSRAAILPFLDASFGDDEGPPSDPETATKSAPPVAPSAHKTPSSPPSRSLALPLLWPVIAGGGMAAGLALSFAFHDPPQPPAAHLGRPVIPVVVAFGDGSTGPTPSPTSITLAAGVFAPQSAIVCPEPIPAPQPPPPPPPPPQNKGDKPEPKINAMNRHAFHAFDRAFQAGDCKSANYFRAMLTGAFAEAVSKWPRCTPAE